MVDTILDNLDIENPFENLSINHTKTLAGNLPELKLSTRSFIISVNCTFNLERIKTVDKVKYIIKSKVRGRKKKAEVVENLNVDIPPGSFIEKVYLNSEGEPNLKKRKKKVFGNSETIILYLNSEKLVNFKVFVNGSIQMTGAKNMDQAKETIKYFIEKIMLFDPEIISIKGKKRLCIYFIPNLCNMNFSIGFMINRNLLDQYMKKYTRYRSLWIGSGYAAVRLNLPVVNYEDKLVVCKMVRRKTEKGETVENPDNWKYSTLSYSDYGRLFPNKKVKDKSITFHVFHSGKINMSSIDDNIMQEYFEELVGILYKCRDEIEEMLE